MDHQLYRGTLEPGNDAWTHSEIALPDRHCFLPYHTNSPWGEDSGGKFLIFLAANDDFTRIWLCTYRPDSGAVREHCELLSRRNAAENREEPLHLLWLNTERAIIMPRGGELVKIWLDSGREEVVYCHPESGYVLRGGAMNSARTRFAYGAYRNAVNEPPRSVLLLVFDSGTPDILSRVDFGRFYAGHFQFTGREEEILYCHEGNTLGIDDRLYLLDLKRKYRRGLYCHARHAETGELVECVGHEFATPTVIGAVRYPDSPGLPGGLLVIDPDGEAIFADADDYWHCAANADGSVFVMDTMWWGNSSRKTPFHSDIVLIDFRNGTKQVIHSMETETLQQFNHPHPQLTDDGNTVVFIRKPAGGYNRILVMNRLVG